MTRRQFRRLTSASGPTLESLTRRKPSRRIFKDLGGLKGIPPVPYPGIIYRHLTPVVIEDTEELSDTTWSTGNFYETYRRNFSLGTDTFVGVEWALYYKHLTIPNGSGVFEAIMEPIRYSVKEPDTNGDNFEHWLATDPAVQNFYLDEQSTVPAGSGTDKRGFCQPLCSSTLLPVSGNSHVSDNTVTSVDIPIRLTSCFGHIANTITGNSFPLATFIAQPRRWFAFIKYAQYRINGVAVGPLHDFGTWQRETLPGQWNSTRIMHPMPSSAFPDYAANGIENWNLEFAPGDSIEIDVWYKVIALRETSARNVIVSLGRYCTANNAQYTDPDDAFTGGGVTRWPGRSTHIAIGGLNMSEGFNPAAHTYLFEPQDGSLTFGKAQVSGSTAFQIDSRHLAWSFTSGLPPATCGTATYRAIATEGVGLTWVLISNDCTSGGTPVEPVDPPTVELETETTACNCDASPPASNVSIVLEMWWDNEMVWMKVIYTFEDEGPVTVYYRPESSGDYVDEVNDRWEGEIHSGPTGCFDHLGATTFWRWNGTQAPPYDDSAYIGNTGSRVVSDYDADIPREILVTKVAR